MIETRATLLERMRNGADDLAWEQFFQAYWWPMFTFAARLGCTEAQAEDVVQNVLLQAFNQRASFQHDPARGRFRNYLFTLIHNEAAAMFRREHPCLPLDGASSAESPAPSPSLESEFERLCELGLLAAMLDVVRQQVEPATFQQD